MAQPNLKRKTLWGDTLEDAYLADDMLDSGEIDVLDVTSSYSDSSSTYNQPLVKGDMTSGLIQDKYYKFAGVSGADFMGAINRHKQGRDKQKANRNAGFTGTQSVLGGGAF